MTDLCASSATELRALIRGREVTRHEVIEAHARRVEQVNGALNAFVVLRLDESLAEADAADARHDERADLPLDGVPISVKETFDLAGYESTLGLPARRGPVAEHDEPAVGRLRAAGAIVLGKANAPDLAIRWNTISSLFGATLNPRDTTRSAGGSTGGDAAVVAAGMAPLGTGADYGGSIRVPASSSCSTSTPAPGAITRSASGREWTSRICSTPIRPSSSSSPVAPAWVRGGCA